MNASRVHAVIAGGVGDPRWLARWATEPEALRVLGVDPSELDLKALRGFAGLALKVRHNGLRSAFGQTFRLLHVAGLEIEVFADYAMALASSRTPLARTDLERARNLVDFIEAWHQPAIIEHALLWTVVRHELALLELTQQEDDAVAGQRASAHDLKASPSPTQVSRLHLRGAVRLQELAHDPGEIARMLGAADPQLGAIAPGARSLCYWRESPACAVRIVELDEFGYAALKAAEAGWSVAALCVSIGVSPRVPRVVRSLLGQLQQAGLLFFSNDRRRVS